MALHKSRITDPGWDYFKEIFFFFESFYFYADEINQLIDKEIGKAKVSYEKFTKEVEINPSWEGEWFDYFSNYQAKIGLTDIYYDSLVMTLYSFVEKKMFFLCNSLSKDQTIKVNDIAGKGIFKYQKYLTKVCGIDFTPIENEWKTLQGYNKLRNHMVHSEGIRSVPKSNKELVDFLRNSNGVELVEEENAFTFHFISDGILLALATAARLIIDHLYVEEV